jgi:cytidine deaminase
LSEVVGLSPGQIDDLVGEAWESRRNAYAPYSHFLVGAVVITSTGEVFRGTNVENASYSVAICAERVAASQAVAAGFRDLVAVAVVSSARSPAPPCGVCRQFLFEFNPVMALVSEGSNGERTTWNLSELLPDGFGPSNLEEAT